MPTLSPPYQLHEDQALTSTYSGSDMPRFLMQPSPKLLASIRGCPHLMREETRPKEVNCSDIEALLVPGNTTFDPRSGRCHHPAHSTFLPPRPWAGPLPLHWVTPQGPGWTVLSLPLMRWGCRLPPGLQPGTCSQPCLLPFSLPSALGFLLLLGFQLVCPQPSTEHRKVSHSHSEAFLLCTRGWCRSSRHPKFCSI